MELKSYTLADADALAKYITEFWPRHIRSLREYGITIHGPWTDASTGGKRVLALVEYPEGQDPADAAGRYRASQDFVDDHADFDVRLITSENSITVEQGVTTHDVLGNG